MSAQAGRGIPAPQVGAGDRWISRAAAGTVAALAGLAATISYSHMRQLAAEHGQAGWHAHAFPLSVDGVEIVASLVLLADRRAGRRSGWLSWTALAVGTAGSLAANVATAGPGVVSRLIAGWPALALLIAVKLLSSMLDRHRPPQPDTVLCLSGPDQDAVGIPSPASGTVPSSEPDSSPVVPDPGDAGTSPVPGWETGADVAGLLTAARAARDGLVRDGRPVTRDALAARLRQNGYTVRNSRLTPLLRALRSEAPVPAPP
jgi:hypothetical protein